MKKAQASGVSGSEGVGASAWSAAMAVDVETRELRPIIRELAVCKDTSKL